jgi:CheY-like chemotaxis protein
MLDKILCVDDDPITLMLCKKVIEKASFAQKIDTAQNGEEALHYFENWIKKNQHSKINHEKNDDYPKLIFLDLNMPIMGGWEFLDNFSKITFSIFEKVKVIVLSSTIDPQDISKAKSYPMVIDFLSKPISKEMLEGLKDVC